MDVRAGRATEAEEAEVPLGLIQEALTHSEVKTTLRCIRRRSAKIARWPRRSTVSAPQNSLGAMLERGSLSAAPGRTILSERLLDTKPHCPWPSRNLSR